MPNPQPPYPSFTLVMSSAPFAAADNMRLPTYRASHLARFHLYPRCHPSHHEERFLKTIDHRFSELSTGPVRGVAAIAPAMVSEDDRKAENRSEAASTIAAESILRRQKLKAAAGRLSAVIVTLRRMYRGRSVKQTEQKLKFDLMN